MPIRSNGAVESSGARPRPDSSSAARSARVSPSRPKASTTARCVELGGQVGELAVGAGLRAAHEHARDRDGDRQQLADDRVLLDRVEPGGHLEAVRRDGDDAREAHLARGLGQPQREAAAEGGAGDDDRLTTRPALDEVGGEGVQLRQHGAVVQARGLAEARQVDGDRAPAAGAELGQQRAPGVRGVAPAVQEHDAGAVRRRPRAPGCDGRRPRSGARERTPCSRTYPFIGSPGQPSTMLDSDERIGRRHREAGSAARQALGAHPRRPAARAGARRAGGGGVPRPGRGGVGRQAPAHVRDRPEEARADGAPASCDDGQRRGRRDRRRRLHHDRSRTWSGWRGSSRGSCSSSPRPTGSTRSTRCARPSCSSSTGSTTTRGGARGARRDRAVRRREVGRRQARARRGDGQAARDDGRQDGPARSSPAG